MWLIALLAASAAATVAHFSRREDSKYLVLMLWGATLMVFVDWLWGYFEEGTLLPEGVLEDPVGSSLLGLVMVVSAIILWLALTLTRRLLGKPA